MTRARLKAPPRRQRPRNAASAANDSHRQIKIGEAARLIGVEAYVLRFWETQFPFLRPRHSHSKHRYYDQRTLDILRLIRRLLHSEGYTIAGAKRHIRENGLDRLCGDAASFKSAPLEPIENGAADSGGSARRGGKLSRATLNKLAAIRDELKSLHKLVAG